MDVAALHHTLTLAWLGLAAVTFLVLQFISAPYGKHIRDGWGPTLPNHIGWAIMETPPIVVFSLSFALGSHKGPVDVAFLCAFLSHYVYRGWIYPFRLPTAGKRMPVIVCALAFTTNILISWLQSWWLFELGPAHTMVWAFDPRFLAGAALFVFGFWLNHDSDAILRRLRAPGETGYRIPHGGGFRFVSSPHYLGEIIEWTGWALATWCLPTTAFLAWTLANLVPRANETHRWYLDRFPDYPRERKRVFPGVY